MGNKTLFEQIALASAMIDSITPNRPRYSILSFAQSEFGELADEVAIAEGHSYKEPGKDGIVGEAIDTIICLIDLIRQEAPHLTEQDLIDIAEAKGEKWIRAVEQHAEQQERQQ